MYIQNISTISLLLIDSTIITIVQATVILFAL